MSTARASQPWAAGLACCLAIAWLPRAAGADAPVAPKPDTAAIARLIDRLGRGQLGEREGATAALEAWGQSALGELRRAVAASRDPEVRRRGRRVIALLEDCSRQGGEFAAMIQEVIETLQESSVARMNTKELAGHVLRALSHSVGEEVPPDLARRLARVTALKDEELRALLWEARARVWRTQRLDPEVVLDRTVERMLPHVDPWASWQPSSPIGCILRVERAGLGLRLEMDARLGFVRVVTPIKDSPAHHAGVRAGDLITHVTVDKDEPVKGVGRSLVLSTKGWSVQEVERRLFGQPETRVRFTVRRKGAVKPLEFDVARREVPPETVFGWKRRRDDNWDYWTDPDRKIAYVRLFYFKPGATRCLGQALSRLNRQGLKGLVLDLRFHPGGLFSETIKTANLFIGRGVITRIRPGQGRERRLEANPEDRLITCPVVCLVNGDTARGAEVVAACLQDHRCARVVGERTRGYGGIQNIQPLAGRQLTLTTAVFLRPSGKKLDLIPLPGHGADEWGVTPDPGFDVPLPARERAALRRHLDALEIIGGPPRRPFRDRQFDLALAWLRSGGRSAPG